MGCDCWLSSRCASGHLTRLTYRRSLSPLVDSCSGVLAAASVLNYWMWLTVLGFCTSGMVIVWGRSCDSCMVIPFYETSLVCRWTISDCFLGNFDSKGVIRKSIAVVNCHCSHVVWDRPVWIGISVVSIFANLTSKQIWHWLWYCNLHCNWHCIRHLIWSLE